MLNVPLSATPSQSLSVQLAGQQCEISVYQKSTGVFLDLSVSDVSIVTAALCVDRVRLIRHDYLGFIGDLAFVDTQGSSDPDYTEFGTRFLLVYIEASEL